jgi:hypothetical protein
MVHPEPVTPILIDDKIGFLLNTHASDLSDKFLKTSDACNTFFNQFIRLWAEEIYVALDDGPAAVVETNEKFLDWRAANVCQNSHGQGLRIRRPKALDGTNSAKRPR